MLGENRRDEHHPIANRLEPNKIVSIPCIRILNGYTLGREIKFGVSILGENGDDIRLCDVIAGQLVELFCPKTGESVHKLMPKNAAI